MKKKILLSLFLLLSQIGFGQQRMYSLTSAPNVTFASTKKWDAQNSYLTAKVYVHAPQSTLAGPFFQGNWTQDLTYFYVNIDVSHSALNVRDNKLNFPLFYIDTKDRRSTIVESEKVLNKIPFAVLV